VEADKAAIRRGLQAILENAIKYSYRDKAVRVQIEVAMGSVCTSVSNFGIGIPKKTVQDLLDRVEGTRARVPDDRAFGKSREGTGTGVPTAISAFREDGGDIEIVSEKKVDGSEPDYHNWLTTVRAYLPLVHFDTRNTHAADK
jgi:signal transduction histidine kinase